MSLKKDSLIDKEMDNFKTEIENHSVIVVPEVKDLDDYYDKLKKFEKANQSKLKASDLREGENDSSYFMVMHPEIYAKLKKLARFLEEKGIDIKSIGFANGGISIYCQDKFITEFIKEKFEETNIEDIEKAFIEHWENAIDPYNFGIKLDERGPLTLDELDGPDSADYNKEFGDGIPARYNNGSLNDILKEKQSEMDKEIKERNETMTKEELQEEKDNYIKAQEAEMEALALFSPTLARMLNS